MKKIFIRLLIIIGLLFLILKGIEYLLERNFQTRINSNPDRAYNISYEDFDLHTLFKGVTLDEVSIQPINETRGTVITGNVDYATLKGLVWIDLLFGKRLSIREISFEQPVFEITLSADTVKKTSGKGIQAMFGDILSRANLESFSIQNGSVILKEPGSGKIKGQIGKVNIEAYELETDSVKLANLIPFNLGNLIVDLEDVTFDLNEYTHLSLAKMQYDFAGKKLEINNLSMGYSIDWVAVSEKIGFQNDVIELTVKEISIHDVQHSSNFYSRLDILAQKILIDSLDIKLQRNKNLTRPPDTEKPMFNGMISAIPIAVNLDSIQILNSTLTYRELGIDKDESGSISIRNIDGIIDGFTNIPEKQKSIGQLEAQLTANLNGYAAMDINLNVPYDREAFELSVGLGQMELEKFNPMVMPLAGVEIKSGELKKLKYQMHASEHISKNNLTFDYSNFHVVLLKEKENHKFKKRPIITMIADATVKNNNLPDQKNYLTATYQSERNIYRSPVNYIIHGLVQGASRIVPGKNIGKMITKDKKKNKKRAK
jgi:hypothetical protein